MISGPAIDVHDAKSGDRDIRGLADICCGGCCAVVGLGRARAVDVLPVRDVPAIASLGLEDVEEVAFEANDGLRLSGWLFTVHVADRAPAVIVFNGNAGNRAYRVPLARALRRLGLQVLLFDYRGYGGNPGSPTEQGLAMDARAAREFLITRRHVDPWSLIYFGESLGPVWPSVAASASSRCAHPPVAVQVDGRRRTASLPVAPGADNCSAIDMTVLRSFRA